MNIFINLTKKSRAIFLKISFYGAALTFFSVVEGLYFSIFLPSILFDEEIKENIFYLNVLCYFMKNICCR